jgi:DNA-binding transcriptional LysR family regulator
MTGRCGWTRPEKRTFNLPTRITFDLLLPALQAANDGLGVALGRSPLVSSDLAAKRLVEPFSIRIRSKSAFYIVSPQDRDVLPNGRLFRNWALNRFGSHALQTAAGSLRPLRERLLRLGGDADHC